MVEQNHFSIKYNHLTSFTALGNAVDSTAVISDQILDRFISFYLLF